MKLTEQHIQSLYTFTRQHYVEHYDLQTELVDHLANDIESIWEEQPRLSFEAARNQSFKKFGVFGFMGVVEKRQNAMHKRYFKYLWKYLKAWFKLPQVITTLAIFSIFYTLFSFNFSLYIFFGLLFLFSFIALYKGFLLRKKAKQRYKMTCKKWLLYDIIFQQNTGGIGIFYLNMFNFYILGDYMFSSNTATLITSLYFTLGLLILCISYFVFPKEAEKLLNETYPEYKLVKQL